MVPAIDTIAGFLQQWSEPIAGLGSLVLTAALVVLYRQQKQLLQDSYDANHKAVVAVEAAATQDDTLELDLSNVGNGVATSLELITVTIPDDESDMEFTVTTDRVTKQRDEKRGGRRAIKAGEDNVAFTARPALGVRFPGGVTQRCTVKSALIEYAREDVSVLRVHCYLRYQDLRDIYHTQYITGFEGEPDDEITTLEGFHETGAEMIHGEPTIDPETLAVDLMNATTSADRSVV